MKFRIALLIFSITFFSVSLYKRYERTQDYNNTLELYNLVCDTDVISDIDSDFIHATKCEIIERIKISNKFDSLTKVFIIDSLKLIPIHIIPDLKKYTGMELDEDEDAAGSFATFNISSQKKNFILVDKKYFTTNNREQIRATINHEIFHFIDKITGSQDKYWSELNNISSVLDNNFNNKEYFRYKIASVVFAHTDLDKVEVKIVDIIYKSCMKNNTYYRSDTEVYVRIHSLKEWLVKQCQMENTGEEIQVKHFGYVIEYGVLNLIREEKDFVMLLFFLNYNQISSLNKFA